MITLEEMENISFRKSGFSGYKCDDVDDFVEKVVQKVKSLERANRELESRLEQQNSEITKCKEKAESVQNALITAEMTAKQIVMEATRKSDEQLSEAKEKAETLVRDAQERAEKIDQEANAKIEELINKTLRESSYQIEENNAIIEAQKENLIRIMSETNKFRNYLIQSYKDHLKIINDMTKPEDIERRKGELDAAYPEMHGNQPIEYQSVAQPAAEQEAAGAEEQAAPKEEEFVFVGGTDEQPEQETASEQAVAETPAVPESTAPAEKEDSITLIGSPMPAIETDVDYRRRKSGKGHKRRR